jgi:hypothetical protein
MEITQKYIDIAKTQLEKFRKTYPNVIGDLGRLGEQELSHKFAEAIGLCERLSLRWEHGTYEHLLLKLLNDGWDKSFFPEGGDWDPKLGW